MTQLIIASWAGIGKRRSLRRFGQKWRSCSKHRDDTDGGGRCAEQGSLLPLIPLRGANRPMRRKIAIFAVFAVSAISATSAHAVFIDSLDCYIENGYHRNVMWPWPYVCPDRLATREPFDIMVRNGWRRQNLLGSHHFDPASGGLTEAGQLQVRWIMTQAPQRGGRFLSSERSTQRSPPRGSLRRASTRLASPSTDNHRKSSKRTSWSRDVPRRSST